jgi:hypothetical protein
MTNSQRSPKAPKFTSLIPRNTSDESEKTRQFCLQGDSTTPCTEYATRKYHWPGIDRPLFCCEIHHLFIVKVASAQGLRLIFERIPP